MSQIVKQESLKAAYLQLPKRRLVLVAPRKSLSATVIYEPKFYPPDVHKHFYIHKGLRRNVSKFSVDRLRTAYIYALLGRNLLRGPFPTRAQRPVNKPPI